MKTEGKTPIQNIHAVARRIGVTTEDVAAAIAWVSTAVMRTTWSFSWDSAP